MRGPHWHAIWSDKSSVNEQTYILFNLIKSVTQSLKTAFNQVCHSGRYSYSDIQEVICIDNHP